MLGLLGGPVGSQANLDSIRLFHQDKVGHAAMQR